MQLVFLFLFFYIAIYLQQIIVVRSVLIYQQTPLVHKCVHTYLWRKVCMYKKFVSICVRMIQDHLGYSLAIY